MIRIPGIVPVLALTVALCAAGCHKDQVQADTTAGQNGPQDSASDPAAANLAPADSTPVVYAAQQNAQPSDSNSSNNQAQYPDQGPDQGSDDPGYGAQPVSYAPQPPPALPDYDQPPAPGDGYLWTPGYWSYSPAGYYWVPGVWVEAPYQGALWTPGYWGFWHHRYGFYRGYWGPHIGYYGGVDYGFGYIGLGYQGGYWGGGHFNYNRSVNNINVSLVHNVYSHTVNESHNGGARVSFNGGVGGLQVRARPAELSARRETHAAPMAAQIQNEHQASQNRAQFANVNHGRPATTAVNQPLAADRNIHAPAGMEMRNHAAPQQNTPAATRPNPVQPAHGNQPAPTQQNQMNHPQTNQPIRNEPNRTAQPQQQATRQAAPQRQAPTAAPQRQAAPQQQRQAAPPQRQAAPERQAAPQRQATPERQAAPQRQASPQQRPAASQQHQAAPQQHSAPAPKAPAKEEERPR